MIEKGCCKDRNFILILRNLKTNISELELLVPLSRRKTASVSMNKKCRANRSPLPLCYSCESKTTKDFSFQFNYQYKSISCGSTNNRETRENARTLHKSNLAKLVTEATRDVQIWSWQIFDQQIENPAGVIQPICREGNAIYPQLILDAVFFIFSWFVLYSQDNFCTMARNGQVSVKDSRLLHFWDCRSESRHFLKFLNFQKNSDIFDLIELLIMNTRIHCHVWKLVITLPDQCVFLYDDQYVFLYDSKTVLPF